MLSYRHAFHAGNFADIHKHAVLSVLLAALQKKEGGLCCIDTHGGTGRYDLQSPEAQKNQEFHGGIGRLWARDDHPAVLSPYLTAIASNQDTERTEWPRVYPGSPRLVRVLLRPQDRLIVSELHPTDAAALKEEFAGDSQVAVHHLDGYQALKAFLPPKERRGLVLIDPAYELRDEGVRAVTGLIAAWQRWPQGTYALWYPLTHRALADTLEQKIIKADVRKSLMAEIHVRPLLDARRLTGSGMLIVNPPWGTEDMLKEICAWLSEALSIEAAGHRVSWLLGE